MPEVVLAVDVGGTKIALALVDDEGTVLAEELRPTRPEPDPLRVVEPLLEGVRRARPPPARRRRAAARRHLLGRPARRAGRHRLAGQHRRVARLPARRARPAGGRRRRPGGRAVVGLANDGHCFALGEHWLGAGRDVASMVGMVLSTGVGAGAVLEDRLFGGHDRQRGPPRPHQRERLGRALRLRRARLRGDVRARPGHGRGREAARLGRGRRRPRPDRRRPCR